MNLEIDELLDVLKKQNTLLDVLKSLSEKQLEVLNNDDLKELSNLTPILEEKGREMALLEKKRQEIIAHIENRIGKEVPHIKELYKYLNNTVAEDLKNISSEIVKKHSKLSETQETNKLLLKQGLKYAKKILKAVTSNTPTTYGKTGTMERNPKISTLDKNV